MLIMLFGFFFFFKQKTSYEMRISDWSSDVCSSDLKALDVRGKATRCARSPHPALRATFSRKREKGWYFRLLAVLRLEIEDQVALEHRLEARVRQRLGLEHRRLDRTAAEF